ncbi:tyrosine protein phosphatase 1 [Linderina pennispora]|nr:tyrosine protein phosphatase 1 [Linderina pennispora]
MTVSTFSQVLRNLPTKASQRDLAATFKEVSRREAEMISLATEHGSHDGHSLEDAQRGRNYDLNRYSNVLPFDDNRVRLEGRNDYINASHIKMPRVTPNTYIATQGPLKHSVGDFWRMVWEQKAQAIVMLVKPVEDGRSKCEMYWPTESQRFGDITVTLESERPMDARGDTLVRKFVLARYGEIRSVVQLHYMEWPDHGVPPSPLPILNIIQYLRSEIVPDAKHPVIVHCSAGVGRTGSFITLDSSIDHLATHHNEYNGDLIMDIFKNLRSQRVMMVQTLDQLAFCYEAVIYSLSEQKRMEKSPA